MAKRKPQNRPKLDRARKARAPRKGGPRPSVWCQCGRVAADWTKGPELVEGVRHAPTELGGCGLEEPLAPAPAAATPAPVIPRKPDGTFAKGARANPGGRPKSLARIIAEESDDGEGREIVRFMFGVMRGTETMKATSALTGVEYDARPSFKDRREAGKWLGEELWGKPRQALDLKTDNGAAATVLEHLSDDELEQAERLLQAAAARAAEKAKAEGGTPGGEA